MVLRFAAVALFSLTAVHASCAESVFLTDSLADWEAKVGSSYANTTSNYGPASTALGSGSISYTSGKVLTVGVNWNTWCCGYGGEVVAMPGSSATVSFPGITAFGFQVEPNKYQEEKITVTLSDGQSISDIVGGEAGAQFFGFVGAGITSLTVVDAVGDIFAFGNFYSSAQSSITLNRLSLMQVEATATPDGGSFKYLVIPQAGNTNVEVEFAAGNTAMSNPNTAQLVDPENPSPLGKPSPGGLAQVKAQYTVNGKSIDDTYQVPTFGMSCYNIALQSDWGVAPNSCESISIYGQKYTGSTKNPPGLAGVFCNSFLAEVAVQGSGTLTSGQNIQYAGPNTRVNLNHGPFKTVGVINGSDRTPVVANKTLARDKSIIPGKGVTLDVDNIGNSLLANDSGYGILGYRLDIFKGAGVAVCGADFDNIMSVSACSPATAACPASTVK
jgi:3D (Asp-Asp-Asp) domain-containing protein